MRGSHSLEIVLAVVVLDCKYVLLSHQYLKVMIYLLCLHSPLSTFSSDKHKYLPLFQNHKPQTDIIFSAHLSCIIEYATTKSNENHKDICKFTQPWEVCPNCNQCCKFRSLFFISYYDAQELKLSHCFAYIIQIVTSSVQIWPTALLN